MKVPTQVQKALYRVKRSQFHGVLLPLSRVEALGAQLKKVRGDYRPARHICWAYRVFTEGKVQERTSDAGEPAGTAGAPILNVLRQQEVVQAAICVARLFGGLKLGRQGLRAAYAHAAELVLAAAAFQPWVARQGLVVKAPLECYGALMQVLKQVEGRLRVDASGPGIYWQVEIPVDHEELFRRLAAERSRGQVEIKGWAGTTKPRR